MPATRALRGRSTLRSTPTRVGRVWICAREEVPSSMAINHVRSAQSVKKPFLTPGWSGILRREQRRENGRVQMPRTGRRRRRRHRDHRTTPMPNGRACRTKEHVEVLALGVRFHSAAGVHDVRWHLERAHDVGIVPLHVFGKPHVLLAVIYVEARVVQIPVCLHDRSKCLDEATACPGSHGHGGVWHLGPRDTSICAHGEAQ